MAPCEATAKKGNAFEHRQEGHWEQERKYHLQLHKTLATVHSSSLQSRSDILEKERSRATKMTKGTEPWLYEESLKRFGLFSLRRRRKLKEMRSSFTSWRGCIKWVQTINCHPHSTAYTQGALCETGLKQIKVAFFTQYLVNFWNWFPQKIVKQAISAVS